MKKLKLNWKNRNFSLILILLVVVIGAQLVLTYYSKNTFHTFVGNTQDWYQNISVKRIANLTSTSLELLVEGQIMQKNIDPVQRNRVIKGIDIILSQNIMEKNADEICLFVNNSRDGFVPVDDGESLFRSVNENKIIRADEKKYKHAKVLFNSVRDELIQMEKIYVIVENEKIFHVFTPFTPNGEFLGVLYMKIVPNLSAISHDFLGSYNNVSYVYIFLVTAGMIIIYIVFSLTLRDKEKAQALAAVEHEKFLKEKIEREKENTFTRRIYHAYHKAEKIIGFINMDLALLKDPGSLEVRDRVQKYSNFIGRVIYDMKYYDPPLHSIINPIFRTDVNEVCRFIVDNLFLRIWKSSRMFSFEQDYAENIPVISVNEYVLWEVAEPLIQNAITHNAEKKIVVKLKTEYVCSEKKIVLTISDNGRGVHPGLLEKNEEGIQKLFLEHVSTQESIERQYGYGCYIAHSLAVKYCGWKMSAANLEQGCEFKIEIFTN